MKELLAYCSSVFELDVDKQIENVENREIYSVIHQ